MDNEMQYGLTMYYVKKLNEYKYISDDEYKEIDAFISKKHCPLQTKLLSGKCMNEHV